MKFLSFFSGRQDLALVAMLMLIILVMIVPLPTVLIDLLIVMSISLTVLILIVAVYLKKPDDFSAFPAIILIATTFRLAVSVSTTRMILSQADAGEIVETFGNFVTQGSVIVGLVIFLIITTVQFVVITKGSERVAEVAARFTLDALPGRQMSIDSELRAGDITQEEAMTRRRALEKENQFFGAMDGAMKFVKGDAIAGLVIIAINLLGGISIGILNEGMSAGEAGQVYSLLTIGDGLVSQLPALIMAICAGTIITRVTTDKLNDLGTDITEQLVGQSKSLFIGAVLISGLGFIPGFPTGLFLAMAAILAIGGWTLHRRDRIDETEPDANGKTTASGRALPGKGEDQNADAAADDIFHIALGEALLGQTDRAGFVEARNSALDKGYERTGISLPVFGLSSASHLDPSALTVNLDGVSIFQGEVPETKIVAICDADILELNGIEVLPLDDHWPLRSAHWVSNEQASNLRDIGVEVLDLPDLLARIGVHFLVRKAPHILGFKLVQEIIRDLAKEHDQLATQVSQTLSPVQLLNVLRTLLEEGVPLKPRRILFEALLEGSLTGGGAVQLAEQARRALSRQVSAAYADKSRMIAGYVIEPALEEQIRNSINYAEESDNFYPSAEVSDILLGDVAEFQAREDLNAAPPVILTHTEMRRPLAQYLRQHNLPVPVLAFRELSDEFQFHPIGTIGVGYAPDAAFEHDEPAQAA